MSLTRWYDVIMVRMELGVLLWYEFLKVKFLEFLFKNSKDRLDVAGSYLLLLLFERICWLHIRSFDDAWFLCSC